MTTLTDDDDRSLVAAAQAGDRAALDRLLRRHYDRVHAICRRLTGSTADAEDAAQEAMIAIVRGLPRFDGRSAFTTWMYRIATNATLDELRRRKRRPALRTATDDGTIVEDVDPLSHRLVTGVETRIDLDRALGGLPDEFRVPVVLRDVADLDYAEIAATLDIPIGTVKSRIARGRALLINALAPENSAPPGNPGGVRERRSVDDLPTTPPPPPPPGAGDDAPPHR